MKAIRVVLRSVAILIVCCAGAAWGQLAVSAAEPTLNLVVMDPLSLPLSCACVDGVGQRRYEPLVEHLEAVIGRKIHLVYEESLQLAKRRGLPSIDLVVGKRSVVLADAEATGVELQAAWDLTDRHGATEIRGVLLVAKNSAIDSVQRLAGKKVAIGSPEHAECHSLPKALFRSRKTDASLIEYDSIESAVYAFADQEVDAVVVTDYLPPLLEACGKLEKNASKTIAQTQPCRGVQFFFAANLPSSVQESLNSAIASAAADPAINDALESQRGFVPATSGAASDQGSRGWTDWRGPDRTGQFAELPASLADQPKVLWRTKVTGPAMAGISATDRWVVVADKSADFQQDLFRAFDAATGKSVWEVRHHADARMEYTNAPRATPVIIADRVLLQSAFGKLMCVELATGRPIWSRDLVADFGGEVPTWGFSVPPLVVGDRVVVAPGSADASLAALSLKSGATLWKTKGHAPAYAPFIFGSFGGREQVIGYDSPGLGGWDLATGRRLWELIPPEKSDFHVGTPVPFQDGVLLATENNAMRWYQFKDDGQIDPQPVWHNLDCAPDTCTPVVVALEDQSRVFCTAYGELFCIDGSDQLETLWSEADERFYDHTCLIAGNRRVLLWGSECDLLLLDATADRLAIVSQWRPMLGEHPESMSHPAIVGDRLYLRSQFELICIQIP
ncbi:MAG: PQQ-binding-like beta-propeller repeat protein [Phycisphaera sp. RhM]|nr:PQQ-binding-like beta-propeller repeat protein [Phycisphaera sp. RhM]